MSARSQLVSSLEGVSTLSAVVLQLPRLSVRSTDRTSVLLTNEVEIRIHVYDVVVVAIRKM